MKKEILIYIFSACAIVLTLFFYIDAPKADPSQKTKRETPLPITTRKETKNISLIAVGDVMLAREVNYLSNKNSNTYWPFVNVGNFLKSADITFANLESPFGNKCPTSHSGTVFCADATQVEGLVQSGIDIVSVANNHAGDQGVEGISFTNKILEENGIKAVGYGKAEIVKIRDTSFGFLAYNNVYPNTPGIAWATKDLIQTDVENLAAKTDVVLVSFHWGNEYTTKLTDSQKIFAHSAIDAGADVIIGHHPHWVQEIKEYKGKPIFYSLGNFVFDQMWSQKTREGLAIKIFFKNDEFVGYQEYPIIIENFGQPKIIK